MEPTSETNQKTGKRVTSETYGNFFRILIHGNLHLAVDTTKLIGLQTWYYNPNFMYVEYYFKDGTKMKSEYNSEDLWMEVVKELNNITV